VVDQFGCKDTQNFVFWAFSPPVANFSVQPPLLSPTLTNIVFTDSSYTTMANDAIVSWHWNFGNKHTPLLPTDTSNLQNPTYQYPDPDTGKKVITLIVYNTIGCPDTFQIPYTVANELVFYNVLTPNGDGKNDVFVIDNLVQKYPENHLKVYDRWGKKIYDKENYHNDWNFDKHVAGTYYYVLSHKDGSNANYFTVIK
jgi:gliding motility-associated-like protein